MSSVDVPGGLVRQGPSEGCDRTDRIENRSGLIHALTEAAELEHGLMVQYLFAAFSMKRQADEGLTLRQAELVRAWEGVILKVAKDEMAHLGNVCNLLTAVGGAPHFRRPNFPVSNRYYPMAGPCGPSYRAFTLEPFSLKAVNQFIAFEAPEPLPLPAETAEPVLRYETVGELYRQISEAIERLAGERTLFVGPQPAQDTDRWTQSLELWSIKDVASALKAIDAIIEEGEAATGNAEGSHWKRFQRIGAQLADELERDPEFAPARPVVANPTTRAHFEASPGLLLDDPLTCRVTELFNWVYETVVLMLLQYYAFAAEPTEQRVALRSTIRRTMSGVIRPLGETITEMPAGPAYPGQNGGPSFELYTDLRLPAQPTNAWRLLMERLDEAVEECGVLRTLPTAPPRLAIVHENLHLAALGLRRGGPVEAA